MIRAFLFDIGNVLVHFDFAIAAKAAVPFCEATDAMDVMRRVESVKHGYEEGLVSRADFLKRSFGALGFRGTEEQFIAAWQGIFTENKPMTALVELLHGRYPLYLLSNTNDMHVEGLYRDFPILNRFAGATFSHEAKAVKPERKIYETACRSHGLDPAETFFIDDLAANIATARELGFQAHHYHHEHHGELLDAIRTMGVEI